MSAADRFRAAARDRDISRAAAEFAEAIRMFNQLGSEPLTGRAAVAGVLAALDAAFDEFEHTGVLTSAESADGGPAGTQAVMFRARIGDQVIEGLDLLEVGPGDTIVTFTVFARPLPALQALGQALAQTRARRTG